MSRAAWWWASSKAPDTVAVGLLPPDVIDPGDQTYYQGEQIDLDVNNIGGAADSWTIDNLPPGLHTQEFTDRLRIYGTVSSTLLAPDVVKPSDQTYYVGQSFDFYIDNIGGAADSWMITGLPNGLQTQSFPGYLRVYGTIQSGVAAPDVLAPSDQTYYIGQTITPLVINNIGGAADSWTATPLPSGLSVTNETATSITISGRVEGSANTGPSIINPGNQTVTVGVPYSLTIYNVGGPIDLPWYVDTDWLPTGLSVTEEDEYHIVISGTPT